MYEITRTVGYPVLGVSYILDRVFDVCWLTDVVYGWVCELMYPLDHWVLLNK